MRRGEGSKLRLTLTVAACLGCVAPLYAQSGGKKPAPGEPVPIIARPGAPATPVVNQTGMEPFRGKPVTPIPIPKRPIIGMPPDMLAPPSKDGAPNPAAPASGGFQK